MPVIKVSLTKVSLTKVFLTHPYAISAVLLTSLLPALFPTNAQADAAAVPPSAQVSYYRSNIGHTGVSTEKLVAPLSLLWRHTTTAAKSNPASAVYGAFTVYFVSGGVVHALNAADGATQWQYPADGKAVTFFATTPALADGFLYVTDDNGQAYKLEAASGKLIWRSKLEGAIRSAPVLSDGIVFFGSGSNHCYALSASTGQTVWDSPTNGAVTTSPTVTGGLVVFASSDDSIYSLNTKTGHKVWSVAFDTDPSIVPVVFDGTNLIVTAGDTLYYLDPNSGRQRSTVKLPTNILIPPTISADSLYVITQTNSLYALGSGGRQRWKAALGSASSAPPLLAGNLLLIPTQSGVLNGYDTVSGKLVWRYAVQASATDSQPKATGTNVNAAPIVADGTLYVVSDDGTLSAFRSDAPDDIAPQFSQLSPAADATVRSTNLTYGALLIDDGSGIDPSSVTLQLDGQPDTQAQYHAEANAVYNTPVTPLTEGKHQITIKAADWHGNVSTQSWSFTVQDSGPQNQGRFNPFNPYGQGYPGAGGRNPNAPPPPPLDFGGGK